jgi:acyl carrier protein
MSNSNDERIKFIMATVFSVDVDMISEHATPHEISSWDSLTHMNLMVALENEFGVELEDDEIESMVSYSVVSATIQAHLE